MMETDMSHLTLKSRKSKARKVNFPGLERSVCDMIADMNAIYNPKLILNMYNQT